MQYEIKTKIANRKNYGNMRSISDIQWIPVHYTGNDGDTDEANANYFANNVVKASAHAFVDDDSVTISVPENYVAWAVGGGKQDQGSPYAKKGAKYYKKVTNTNSYSVEMCDTIKNGKRMVSDKTRENAIDYIARKMIDFGVDINHVIRHFDVTGKLCPIYYVTDEKAWKQFKSDLNKRYKMLVKEKKKSLPTVPKNTLKKGSKGTKVGQLQKCLNYLGIKDDDGKKLEIDKSFGNATYEAMKNFQKKYGLEVDGSYGPASYEKMKSVIK